MLLVTQSQQEEDVASRKLDSGGTARYFSIPPSSLPHPHPVVQDAKIHKPNSACFLELHKRFGLI